MKNITIFTFIIISLSAASLNASAWHKPKANSKIRVLLKLAKAEDEYKNHNQLNDSLEHDYTKQELAAYRQNLTQYSNSWLPLMKKFMTGASQLAVGAVCAHRAYKTYCGKNDRDNLDFCLFIGGAATLLLRGYNNCKNAIMWKSFIAEKMKTVDAAKTVFNEKIL